MRQSSIVRSHGSFALVVLASIFAPALPAAAQDPTAEEGLLAAPDLQEAKRKMGVGRIALRSEYFDQRRRNPADPDFDWSQARERALEDRAEAALAQTGGGPDFVWSSIGPSPTTGAQTPQDFQQPSPVSGRTTDLAIDPVDFRIYLGGAQGGLWTSDDNGATWTPRTDHLGSLATGSIVIDPSDRNIVYYGTGEGNLSGDSYAGVGVFKSTDRGATWSGPFGAVEFRGRSVSGLGVDRTNSNVLIAGSSSGVAGAGGAQNPPVLPTRGIYKSTDGGATWSLRASPPGMAADVRASIVLQDPLVSTRWYAAMSNLDSVSGGLWLSVDNGDTWTSLNGVGGAPGLAVPPAVGLNRYWITGTANAGDGQSTLYLGTGHNNASTARGGQIYRSTDSGSTWALQPGGNDYCMSQCFYDMPLWVEPGNKNNIYHGGAGAVDSAGVTKSTLRRSTDGGVTFTDIMRCVAPCTVNGGPTALHSDTHAIATQPGSGNVLWVGNDGGIWRSTDRGSTWQNRNTNLALTQFTAFDVNRSSAANQAYGGTQDNGTMGWTGSGVAWPHLDFGDGGYAQIDQGNPNNLVHTYFNQSNNLIGVGCTTNGFVTTQGSYLQSFAPTNGIAIADRVQFYAPIHLDRGTGAATSTLYFGTHRIWRASNFFATGCGTGAAVFASLTGATDLLGGTGSFSAIETQGNAVAGTNANVVAAGSSTGRVFLTVNATAGVPTFNELDLTLSPKPFVADVLIDPDTAMTPGVSGTIWVARSGFFGSATGNQIRRSTDGGATWVAAGNGIPDIPVNAIAKDPLVDGRLWAGTDIGIYVSNDDGLNWSLESDGLPNAAVFDIKTSPLPAGVGAVIAVTHGRGAWRLETVSNEIFLDGFETGVYCEWTQVTGGAPCV